MLLWHTYSVYVGDFITQDTMLCKYSSRVRPRVYFKGGRRAFAHNPQELVCPPRNVVHVFVVSGH